MARSADPSRAAVLAIYLSPGKQTTPLALKADVEHHGVFHEKVLIVSVDTVSVPHVEPRRRFVVETLGSGLFKITHVTIRDRVSATNRRPGALALARKRGLLERNLDLEHASYFLSRITITATRGARNEPLAQAAVHDDGPQRREPDRHLPVARRPHRRGRITDPDLSGSLILSLTLRFQVCPPRAFVRAAAASSSGSSAVAGSGRRTAGPWTPRIAASSPPRPKTGAAIALTSTSRSPKTVP